jgi:DNA-binding NarL/FixJ family response regulator
MEALVISDQPLTVLGIRSLLRTVDQAVNVCDATHMGEAMGMLCGEHRIGLIVLDLDTHGARPLMNIALLRDMWPAIPLVVMSSKDCDSTIVKAVDLGVVGYLLKSTDNDTLRAALKQVLAGDVYLPEFKLAA